jgi:hypothetical protein
MSMSEPRSIHAAEDWGVVLQSVPSKNKREIVKRLEEIFGLDKHDAEQILSNMPLILVDNLSFGLAARIKKFFQTVGAVSETTNHDMIKKNCFQVLWPQTPDLSFFMKNETGPAEASAPEKKSDAKAAESHSFEKKAVSDEVKQEIPMKQEPVLPAKAVDEAPAIASQAHPVPEEKSAEPSPSAADSDWERRAKELNEKIRKIHEEKQDLHVQHAEATEKVKNEFQQQIEEEKKKSGEIAKAYEDLQKEAQKQEALTREGEEWRARAVALGEKVRELETNLMQKTSAIEHMIHEKDALVSRAEKAEALAVRLEEVEKIAAAKEGEGAVLQGRVSELEASLSEASRQLGGSRDREQELARKVAALEQNAGEMSESMRSRDGALAQFEKQVIELSEKVHEFEAVRQEHARLLQERATIRQEYDAKLVEQEVRLAKGDEEHRRYRSRTDRKNAAATRELGEWIRGVDTIRQGLQKLILFLGSESAVLENEKKSPLRSPLTRGPDAPASEKS